MEKPATKHKSNNILRFLPKTGAVSFQNPPYSPAKDHRAHVKLRKHFQRAFSGPITYMIPAEACGKSKNFETTQEPTSPKISCMGQIKHKKIVTKKENMSRAKESKPVSSPKPAKSPGHEVKNKKQLGLKNIFGNRRKFGASIDSGAKTPSLSHTRRFASTRDTFANFDWTTAHEEESDVIIPFSEPILDSGASGLGLEPRKEINLWKRRTMAQPKPLQLNLFEEVQL